MTETYYTVLGVARSASNAELKAAWRELIRQTHPDSIPTASAYWKKQAEERSKEINEAYEVLSDPVKRRRYDELLDAYKQGQQPQRVAPSPDRNTHQPGPTYSAPASPRYSKAQKVGWAVWCLIWGASWSWSLYSLGETPGETVIAFLMACVSFGWAAWTSASWIGMLLSKFGIRKIRKQFYVVTGSILIALLIVVSAGINTNGLPGSLTRKPTTALQPTSPPVQILKSTVANSAFHCEIGQKVTDGGRCAELSSEAFNHEKDPTPTKVRFGGNYFGSVNNKTANLSAAFKVLLQDRPGAVINGCMDVTAPLYGSGLLLGSAHGSHVNFAVGNIQFEGDMKGKEITGSYLVSKQNGVQEIGDFQLTKNTSSEYKCNKGLLTKIQRDPAEGLDFQTAAPEPMRPFGNATVVRWLEVGKLCAFDTGTLPCGYDDGKFGAIANLREGDRVKILSSRKRARNGTDIYKIRTAQGWEGWIDANNVTLDQN